MADRLGAANLMTFQVRSALYFFYIPHTKFSIIFTCEVKKIHIIIIRNDEKA